MGLESDVALADTAKAALAEAKVANVKVVTGELTQGYKPGALYDVIVIEGAVEEKFRPALKSNWTSAAGSLPSWLQAACRAQCLLAGQKLALLAASPLTLRPRD